jgi:hypothetical protein
MNTGKAGLAQRCHTAVLPAERDEEVAKHAARVLLSMRVQIAVLRDPPGTTRTK